MDGDHDIETTAYYTERVLSFTFRALNEFDVCLDAALLKPNMVNPGNDCPTKVSAEEVAQYTIQTMMRGVPGAMPGIHFLSGGMSDAEATANLQLLNTLEEGKRAAFAWNFSYGRALQIAVLKLWAGDDAKKDEAQALLTKLARANSMAQQGKFSGEHPSPGGSARNWQPLRLV